ncbi:MAG: 7-cyano-7-deazaguanine synthase QueC [Candidatus Margulisiibacteriota bacterium]
MTAPKAVILLSGGLDSTTTLYYAQKQRYQCFALIFNYGQRHHKEIQHAKKIAKLAGVHYRVMKIDLPWKGSSLLDRNKKVPHLRSLSEIAREIPSTYVPARNTIFLSFAVSYAEAIGAEAVFIGANAIDFSGYPDCRPSFYRAFQKIIATGTKAGVAAAASRKPGTVPSIKIITPLIHLTKPQIVALGRRLHAPLELTWSCYLGGKRPCGKCDSCRLREKGLGKE